MIPRSVLDLVGLNIGTTPDSAFGLLRGGGFYDQPEQLSNFYVFEQMDRQYAQAYAGFRLVRRLEY